jgi:hypothetical protein
MSRGGQSDQHSDKKQEFDYFHFVPP